MSRKRTLIHLVSWSTLVVLIIIVAETNFVEADAAGEIRSLPVYVQSRPVYNKPTPKPKPKLVLPKQLQNVQVQQDSPNSGKSFKAKVPTGEVNPNLVTQTVYGFLDFVTTIGNTVMIFTPQTKKVDLIQPSIAIPKETVYLQPTQLADLTEEPSSRQPKLISMEEESDEGDAAKPVVLESSEYEPQATSTLTPTPAASSEMQYVNLMSEAPTTSTPKQDKKPFIVTAEPEVRTQVNIVVSESGGSGEETPASPPKGFTLKLGKAAFSSSSTKETPKLPDLPTGIVSQNFETRVKDGVTTVHETKILGTYIGNQYARVMESSSTVLPFVVTASRAPSTTLEPKTQAPTTTPAPPSTSTTPKKPFLVQAVSENQEVHTVRSVSSSSNSNLENDERFNEELLEDEEGPDEDAPEENASAAVIEPTPTASEEKTQYILPQKEKKAQIYVSAVPSPNAYSRQPQIYVDISPAKSFDYVVTATPSRKQFRGQSSRNEYLNRFSNRNANNKTPPPSSTESNELTERTVQTYEANLDDSAGSSRRTNRFRSRNRSGSKARQNSEPEILPTVSVYSNAVTATPSRRFTPNSRTRSPGKNMQESVTFKTPTAQRGGGYSPATRGISPTSSTSIYRFKLNRPTGRWRFKPSPKPKVNIIKTKEEEDLLTTPSSQKEILHQQGSGAVYPQGYNENGEPLEIQNLEESRAESNELSHDEQELLPQTVRVATITPSEFSDLDKYLEVATIRSPYVFQAGNVKNTRYITLTKTFTKENIQPTQASAFGDPSLENILATRPPYERILEGSNDVATLPLIVLGSDTATPPLETVTQTFSTTQLMLKTSILPVLYEGVTTLYTLTQSYFITRLVTAHKTVPPMELFQFAPSKSLTEFNTALQEAGSEHREQLLSSEADGEEHENAYSHIIAPPDELTSVGSDFDPSTMDEKYPKPAPQPQKSSKTLIPKARAAAEAGIPDLSNLTADQIAFLRYFSSVGSQPQHAIPMQNPNPFFPSPLLPSLQPQFQLQSSPVVIDTVTTIVETKTLRLQFGSKPTQTTIYSTRVVPTKVTSYLTASVPATAAIPNFFQQAPYPLSFLG